MQPGDDVLQVVGILLQVEAMVGCQLLAGIRYQGALGRQDILDDLHKAGIIPNVTAVGRHKAGERVALDIQLD